MAKKTFSKAKKGVRAKSIKKKVNHGAKSTEVVYHSTKEIKVEKALIDNFIGLQKVMVNLSNKFDGLSDQISKLLDLFEISAKSLAKKELSSPGNFNTLSAQADTKRILDRLDNISKQAGLIGRGLALIHEVGTENGNPVIPPNPQRNGIFSAGQTFSSTGNNMQNKAVGQNMQSPIIPIKTNVVESGANIMGMESGKKLTKELDSFEKSSPNDSNNIS